jgi:hypothetical protein
VEWIAVDKIVDKAYLNVVIDTTSATKSHSFNFTCTEQLKPGSSMDNCKIGDIIPLETPLAGCIPCNLSSGSSEYEQFRERHQPPAADYYSGGGGGIIGGSGFFTCKHAVEMDPISCRTLR